MQNMSSARNLPAMVTSHGGESSRVFGRLNSEERLAASRFSQVKRGCEETGEKSNHYEAKNVRQLHEGFK